MSAMGVLGDPGGGLLPWPSLPESRLSGGFSVAPLLPSVGQPPPPPPSLAEAQTGENGHVEKDDQSSNTKMQRSYQRGRLKFILNVFMLIY